MKKHYFFMISKASENKPSSYDQLKQARKGGSYSYMFKGEFMY